MKKFLIKLLVFVFPFSLLLPFLYVAYMSMEIQDYDQIIKKQVTSENNLVVGMAYHEDTVYYKYSRVNEISPQVCAFGTSRVMQFREYEFKESFYNLGGCVGGNFREYKNFLENIEDDSKPQIILLGLDQWVFNTESPFSQLDSPAHRITKLPIDTIGIIRSIINAWVDHSWSFREFIQSKENIGFNGIFKGDGYLKDGSYYYNSVYNHPEDQKDYGFKDTFRRIDEGNGRFEHGSDICTGTLEQLDELLSYCNEAEIYVVAFLPPFAPSVYDYMKDNGNMTYIDKIYDAAVPLFDVYGYELYDYTDSDTSLGVSDDMFIDGFHGSDTVYLLMLQDMVRRDSRIKDFCLGDGELVDIYYNRDSELCLQYINNH